jgi:hypothetical protein
LIRLIGIWDVNEMEYLDFDLQIERSGEQFLARVVDSPAGQAENIFKLPFEQKELETFRLRIGQPRQSERGLDSPEMALAEAFGARLFEAVIDEEVQACFRSSHDHAQREGMGLRIHLRIRDPQLAGLPWEYMYNCSQGSFLSLAIDTPVVRYLDLPRPIVPLEVTPPLKILAVIANPKDLVTLDVEGEWRRLNEALSGVIANGSAALDRLESPTLIDLAKQLRRGGPYHILHFVGHGDFDEKADDGLLIFENEQGYSQPVDGQRLATILHNSPSLRLAVLNACEGARTSMVEPFAGVAHSLIQQGLPAVIAMQFEITDQAALTFGREFYSAVAAGFSVDEALGEARVAIFAGGNDIEWGTPVLFTRLPDGFIFRLGAEAAPRPPSARFQTSGPLEAERARQAQQAYKAGLAAFFRQDWEQARGALQEALDHFERLEILDKDDPNPDELLPAARKALKALLDYIEDLEDRALIQEKLVRLQQGPEKSGATPWEEASPWATLLEAVEGHA